MPWGRTLFAVLVLLAAGLAGSTQQLAVRSPAAARLLLGLPLYRPAGPDQLAGDPLGPDQFDPSRLQLIGNRGVNKRALTLLSRLGPIRKALRRAGTSQGEDSQFDLRTFRPRWSIKMDQRAPGPLRWG